MKILIIYVVIISLIAFVSKNGASGILSTASRFKNYVVSHKLFIGSIGFIGESFFSVGCNTMSITVAAKLVVAAIGTYTVVDLNTFFYAGLAMSFVGWMMKIWYNKNNK